MAERPVRIKGEDEKAEWEQAIAHELVQKECTECNQIATWTRGYTFKDDLVDVFTCRSCGHEMHMSREEEPTAT